jgi:hypothetical protein
LLVLFVAGAAGGVRQVVDHTPLEMICTAFFHQDVRPLGQLLSGHKGEFGAYSKQELPETRRT